MLFTLTSTAAGATDLGYLLHKHPDRVQTFELPVGTATVCYPEATDERCTAALLLEVDPIGLVQRKRGGGQGGPDGFVLGQYVNDRPYAASSLLAVALGRVFGTALAGRCEARPELVDAELPLEIRIPALPARAASAALGGADLVRALFEPLGWLVEARAEPLAPGLDWGDAPYLDVRLVGRLRLAAALSHCYVLLPVLDNAKHYWVGPAEVDKLVRRGGAWLGDHPQRELIMSRYLAAQRAYVRDATARLDELDDRVDGRTLEDGADDERFVPTTKLKEVRRDAVLAALRDVGARRVVDLGCGEGYYLHALLEDPAFTEIVGVDVSVPTLERARQRLGLERRSDRQRDRVTLRQSSATYRDDTLAGYDALLLVEVIEHVDPDRLPALERNVFAFAGARTVVVTTPNAEHNVRYGLAAGALRHADHRFEWTRDEFASWAGAVADRHGYAVEFRPVGADDPEVGPPTQLALFTRTAAAGGDAS